MIFALVVFFRRRTEHLHVSAKQLPVLMVPVNAGMNNILLFIAIIIAILTIQVVIMKFDTSEIISITAANQNFSSATKIADKNGRAIIFKNNRPKYMLVNLDEQPMNEMSEDERIMSVARRILEEHKAAFLELAK